MNLLKIFLKRVYTIRFGAYVATLSFSRISEGGAEVVTNLADFNFRQVLFILNKYPVLKQLKIPVERETVAEILQCYLEIIPTIEPEASEVCIRNALHRLKEKTTNLQLKKAATLEIARSDLRQGIPDRAKVLINDVEFGKDLVKQLALSDVAYGAPLLTQDWPNISRGRALCYYFREHEDLLRGKSILHISPEPELREYIKRNAQKLDLKYQTSNLMGEDVDINQDLTSITLEDSYDVVICHRVLEHVLDDRKALQELYRIVKLGGFLQVSVPQSMHQTNTREWIVPDETHHDHVRHYGRDFLTRLGAAGFSVQEELWLLQRPREELLANESYPLRMYKAHKL